jgi:hypothetical protein
MNDATPNHAQLGTARRQDRPAHYRWMWTFVHLIRWQRDAERATVPQ